MQNSSPVHHCSAKRVPLRSLLLWSAVFLIKYLSISAVQCTCTWWQTRVQVADRVYLPRLLVAWFLLFPSPSLSPYWPNFVKKNFKSFQNYSDGLPKLRGCCLKQVTAFEIQEASWARFTSFFQGSTYAVEDSWLSLTCFKTPSCEYCPKKSELSVVDLEDFWKCLVWCLRVFIKAVNRILFTLSNDFSLYLLPPLRGT